MLNILMTGQDASKIEAVDYTLSKVLECIMKKDALRIFLEGIFAFSLTFAQ